LRNLRIRLASLGIVAGVLVLIWALTGPELPWIAWPLLGIGLIAALDAWRVYATPRTRFEQHVGAQVILNVFIIGVWVAAGAGDYFWPAWVMVGSAIAIGIHALAGGSRRPATN
jgi:small basic protein